MTEAVDNYLKALFKLSEEDAPAGARRVATGELAALLGVRAASVSGMLKRLATGRPRLVDYSRHGGARLTAAGRRHALSVLRRHRLLELFLQEKLGFSWDEVHVEADRLEHAASDAFTEKLAAFLGHPHTDPHGELIPDADGNLPMREEVCLTEVTEGRSLRVLRVSSPDDAELRHLADKGVRPGARLLLEERDPYGGSFTMLCEGRKIQLGPQVAARVYVELES